MTIYSSDVLPLLLIAGSATQGLRHVAWPPVTRTCVTAGVVVGGLVLVGFYRSMGSHGITPALQARHLVPLALAITLPYARGFAAIRSRTIANALSVGAVAIAVASFIRLGAGYTTTSAIGVERIYQTWEPFISACILLILLAFCLIGTRPAALHYIGLAAASVPVIFSFFRVAWLLTFAVAIAVIFVVRGHSGRAWLVLAMAAVGFVLIGGGAISSHGGPTFASQIVARGNAIPTQLDAYRSQEYRAVWREIRRDPFFGSGFGTEYVGNWTLIRSWCHNAYEWMWWRLGFVGLVAFFVFLGSALAAAIGAARRMEGDDRGLAVGLSAALLFLVVAANFHENFENYQSNLVNGVLIAQVLVLRTRAASSGK
jgi:hypothetical protein